MKKENSPKYISANSFANTIIIFHLHLRFLAFRIILIFKVSADNELLSLVENAAGLLPWRSWRWCLNQKGKGSNRKETNLNLVQGLHDVMNICKSCFPKNRNQLLNALQKGCLLLLKKLEIKTQFERSFTSGWTLDQVHVRGTMYF